MAKDWTYEKLHDLRREIESGPAECSGEIAVDYVYQLLDAVLDLHADLQAIGRREGNKN